MTAKSKNHTNALFVAGIFFATSWQSAAQAQNAGENSSRAGANESLIDSLTQSEAVKTNRSNDTDNVLLSAETVSRSEDESLIIATGNVEARHQGRRLISDKLTYDQTTGIVKAYGHVTIIEKDGTTTFADEIIVDDKLATGIVNNFAAKLGDGSTVAAKVALRNQNGKNLLSKTVYTACPVCVARPHPTWQIRARTAVQDQKEKTLSYNDVVFEIKGVPVLYIPYFKHGDPTAGRQSGFLTATPGHSGRMGTTYKQPYLWVIDDYSDLTIAPQINQYINPILYGEYRRNFYSGNLRLEGSFTREKFFGTRHVKFGDTDWRSHLFGQGAFKLNDTWKWGFGAESASDELYLYRYGLSALSEQRGPVYSTGARLVNQIYVEGKSDDFYSRLLGVHFQDMTGAQRRLQTPRVLPTFDAEKSWKMGPLNGHLSAKTSALYLTRKENGQSNARISGALNWSGQAVLKNGIIIAPNLYGRSDYYSYKNQVDENAVNIGSNKFARANASANVDIRWPFVKIAKNSTFTIEPRVNIATATIDKKQDLISIEDSVGLENDSQNYFLANNNSIYDYWDGGSRITIGSNFGINTNSNINANFMIAKQFRAKPSFVLDRVANFDQKDADWVTNFNLNYKGKFTFGGNSRIDNKGKFVRTTLLSSANYGPITAYANYLKLNSSVTKSHLPTDEIVYGGTYKINKNFALFADDWYDLNEKRHWHTRAGVDWTDECTTIRFYYQETNTINRFVQPSRNFKIEIAFKSLGKINDSPFRPY